MRLTEADKRVAKRGYIGPILADLTHPLWGRRYRGKDYL